MLVFGTFLNSMGLLWAAGTTLGAGQGNLTSQPLFHGPSLVVSVPSHTVSATMLDSAPVLTMTVVKQLSAAQRAIDSITAVHPLASSRVAPWEMPRSIDGKIARMIAELNSRPALISAVTANGFPNTKSYARALIWLNTAWSLVLVERTHAATGAGSSPEQLSVPGMSNELLTFVRAHEPELVSLGFTRPQSSVITDVTERERSSSTQHFRQFLDSAAHTIRIVSSPESDFLQGFIDSADGTTPGAAAQPPLRILFLGNSLTYYHEMPRLFAHLAAVGLHRRVVAGLVSLPGTSLPRLWNGTDVREVLQKLPWDVVVLQVRPDGLNDTINRQYARMVSAPIIARGGRAFAWGQYRGPDEPTSFQMALDEVVGDAAHASHATVAPIPVVWDAVRQADTVVWKGLFYDLPSGDTHPSRLGSYLLALSFYRIVTTQSPVGLPHVVGDFVIPQNDAEELQRIVISALP